MRLALILLFIPMVVLPQEITMEVLILRWTMPEEFNEEGVPVPMPLTAFELECLSEPAQPNITPYDFVQRLVPTRLEYQSTFLVGTHTCYVRGMIGEERVIEAGPAIFKVPFDQSQPRPILSFEALGGTGI